MKVVSGMRPTGRLHLGNYWGALRNWVELQGKHDCFFFVADWHVLTTGYEDTRSIKEDTREMVLDWLAAGLDPGRCIIFQQSQVPEHAELALLLSMLTPLGWLLRNPTYKEQLDELYKRRFAGRTPPLKVQDFSAGAVVSTGASVVNSAASGSPTVLEKAFSISGVDQAEAVSDLNTHGFVGYPVLQAADILAYKGEAVPVGQDQVAHLELTREIARRFNSLYGQVFPEPKPLLTPTPKVPGIDAKKMSKSYGNTVELGEAEDSLREKVMSMYTDPKKARKTDKGHPEPCPENPPGCVVFALHKLYTSDWQVVERECREGLRGCVDCKKHLLTNLGPGAEELRRRRAGFSSGQVDELLREGSRKARELSARTLAETRSAMHLVHL